MDLQAGGIVGQIPFMEVHAVVLVQQINGILLTDKYAFLPTHAPLFAMSLRKLNKKKVL